MSDFIPNRLYFNSVGCMNEIKHIIGMQLDKLSVLMIRIISTEIQKNGNGSSKMKSRAIQNVKETKREITNDHVTLEVGIDLDELKGDEELFVCVSVVLHGNMNGAAWTWRDAQVMYTKPGVATYGKHVTDKRVHVPSHWKPRAMPGFAQPDESRGMYENIDKEIEKHVDDFMNNVVNAIDHMDWSVFIIGG